MRKPHANANKADPVADALEAISGQEWRKMGEVYECRVNHTHARAIETEFAEASIPVHVAVSEARSGRYFLTVQAADGPQAVNAASRLPTQD